MSKLFPKPGTLFITKNEYAKLWNGKHFMNMVSVEKGSILMFLSHKKRFYGGRSYKFLDKNGIVVLFVERSDDGYKSPFDLIAAKESFENLFERIEL